MLLPANSILASLTLKCRTANPVRRLRSFRAAACAALPFISEPLDAAVAEAFGTLLVSVAVVRIRSKQEQAPASAIDRHAAMGFEVGQAAAWNQGPFIGFHRVEEGLPDGTGQCAIEEQKS